MAKQVLALVNAPETDVAAVVKRATAGGPSPKETIAKQLPGRKQEVAQAAGSPPLPGAAIAVIDPREILLSATESKDFAQAYSNWLMGETLAGREFPDDKVQTQVRSGLVDTLLNQRPGGADQFARFIGGGF